jgi:putative hydrolase of the HAD superfamily
MKINIHNARARDVMPAAVLLDTDNTLYPYEPAHRAAMTAARAKAGQLFNLSEADFEQAFDAARRGVKARLAGTASSHSRLLYFQRMLEIIGLGSQVLLALDLEQTYWRTFLGSATLFDGLKDFLDELRLIGVPIAIVTDLTAQIQFRKIVYFGLDQHFDFVVTSEEAGFDKPHAAPFLIAAEKMRADGKCIWMIGDDGANDIEGARAALGAITFQKVHDKVEVGTGDRRPDVEFASFVDLRAFLLEVVERTSGKEPAQV